MHQAEAKDIALDQFSMRFAAQGDILQPQPRTRLAIWYRDGSYLGPVARSVPCRFEQADTHHHDRYRADGDFKYSHGPYKELDQE